MNLTFNPRILFPLLCFLGVAVAAGEQTKPNIVLFFIDDMGYGDIGPFGATLSETPNLDRLAAEGVTMTNFYVSATACTPSRAALMTGSYADRIDMDRSVVFPGDKRGLNPSEVTIADMLQEHGYATACIGKWHLGDAPEFMPEKQGFDTYTGIPYSNDMWSGHKSHPPLPFMKDHDAVAHISDGLDQALLGDALSEAAVEFITECKDEPFFLYFPHSMVHVPRYVLQERADKIEGEFEPVELALKVQIEEIDASVGRVMETLENHGLAENTLIFFTSDNGGSGATSMGGLRGGKGGAKYEGHMRASTVAKWPARIPAGTVTSELASTIDLLPTIASISGAKVPEDRVIDGKDIASLLTDPGAKSPHPRLFYEYEGVREGNWKLVIPKPKKNQKAPAPELFDLSTDAGEQSDIAGKHPEKVKEFMALLEAHRESIQSKQRMAGYVDNPKPITTEGLPSLATLLGREGESVMTEGALGGHSNMVKKKNSAGVPAAKIPATERIKLAPKKQVTPGEKPDVLFIAIDDMNDWTTLFDEDNPIQTPNLKRLAARGAFFSRAYCAVPACNPSRTAILTGLAPTTSGVYGNGDPWKKLLPNVATLPQYFGNQGYHTKGGGKIFHHGGTGTDREDQPSFDEFFPLRIHANKPEANYNGYVRGQDVRQLASQSWDWGVHDVEKQTDEFTVDYVTEVMRTARKDEPLFLAAGIFRPHLPFWAPPETFQRYPFDGVELPPRPEDDLDDVPPLGVKMSRTEAFIFDNASPPPEDRPGSLKKMVQCYQAASDYSDEMVGRLIDVLDATGRAENTIIVLWSDHGYHLGDKSACVKFTLWEKANRVPFIIVAPGVTTPGTVIERPVSLVDIYPTLIELAGLPEKEGLDGVSLIPLLKNPDAEWARPAVMTQGEGNHAVRSDRWRYIRYNDGTEELYDHENDPWEWTNLAGKPEHAAVIAEHREWLPQAKPRPKPVVSKPARKPAPRRPFRIDVTPAEYQPAETDILIADFEGEDYGDWKVTGEAFGDGPSHSDTHKNRITGFLGQGFINTYRDGDKSTGELISPPFAMERKFINFLIGGGKHRGRTGIQLVVNGTVVRTAAGHDLKNPGNEEILDWQSLDVSEFIGKQAVLKIVDRHEGGWGHTVVDHIFQSDQSMLSSIPVALNQNPRPKPATMVTNNSANFVPPPKPGVELEDEWSTFPLYDQVGYDQSLRPQFHFTSRMGWLNDPNGMVYYDGEWLMYFQHNPVLNDTGIKAWGAAISPDLMRWQQLPHAIKPYPNVMWEGGPVHSIWSGSAVVDVNNALGKQQGDVKTLFGLYTATHRTADDVNAFFQGGVYSTDRGRTWTKIDGGRPVIEHVEGFSPGQRDPRIIYYEPGDYYITIMMIGGPERKVRLWKSTDLLNWEPFLDIPNKAAECIDLYSVAVDGDPANRKWVIADANTHYEVGDFDGETWTGFGAEDENGKRHRFDYGDSWYAAQAFNQAPEGRVVHIGWLRSKQAGFRPFHEAGMPFSQQMSIPIEITLRTTPEGIRLFRNPVKEIETLYTRTETLENLTAAEANEQLTGFQPELVDLTLRACADEDFTVNVRGLEIQFDAAAEEFVFTNSARVQGEKAAWNRNGPYRDDGVRRIPAPPTDGIVTLRALVDRASLELFINDGQAAASFVVVPEAADRNLAIEGSEACQIHALVVHELKSAWESGVTAGP